MTEIPIKILYKIYPFSSWYWGFGAIKTFCNKLMKLRGESSIKATTKLPAKSLGQAKSFTLTPVFSRRQFRTVQGEGKGEDGGCQWEGSLQDGM